MEFSNNLRKLSITSQFKLVWINLENFIKMNVILQLFQIYIAYMKIEMNIKKSFIESVIVDTTEKNTFKYYVSFAVVPPRFEYR